jgi:hypothetical protein
MSTDDPDKGLFGLYFANVGDCDKPNFRWPGLMIATLNQWVIDFMEGLNGRSLKQHGQNKIGDADYRDLASL